jgi:hypothetical protein
MLLGQILAQLTGLLGTDAFDVDAAPACILGHGASFVHVDPGIRPTMWLRTCWIASKANAYNRPFSSVISAWSGSSPGIR